jgi:Sulfotransferase domain
MNTSEDGDPNFLTIVSGLPRSGTSMMMRMLEAGGMPVLVDHVRQPDEDNPRGYYEFEAVKKTKADPSWLQGSEGKAVKMVYRLLYDLPANRRYRVLFMQRHLGEVLASQQVMLRRGGVSGGVADEQMQGFFNAELKALREWVARQSHVDLLEVDYNRMLHDARAELRRVADFLGRELDENAMDGVVDASLYRNRR